jgi:hypothetical protein
MQNLTKNRRKFIGCSSESSQIKSIVEEKNEMELPRTIVDPNVSYRLIYRIYIGLVVVMQREK